MNLAFLQCLEDPTATLIDHEAKVLHDALVALQSGKCPANERQLYQRAWTAVKKKTTAFWPCMQKCLLNFTQRPARMYLWVALAERLSSEQPINSGTLLSLRSFIGTQISRLTDRSADPQTARSQLLLLDRIMVEICLKDGSYSCLFDECCKTSIDNNAIAYNNLKFLEIFLKTVYEKQSSENYEGCVETSYTLRSHLQTRSTFIVDLLEFHSEQFVNGRPNNLGLVLHIITSILDFVPAHFIFLSKFASRLAELSLTEMRPAVLRCFASLFAVDLSTDDILQEGRANIVSYQLALLQKIIDHGIIVDNSAQAKVVFQLIESILKQHNQLFEHKTQLGLKILHYISQKAHMNEEFPSDSQICLAHILQCVAAIIQYWVPSEAYKAQTLIVNLFSRHLMTCPFVYFGSYKKMKLIEAQLSTKSAYNDYYYMLFKALKLICSNAPALNGFINAFEVELEQFSKHFRGIKLVEASSQLCRLAWLGVASEKMTSNSSVCLKLFKLLRKLESSHQMPETLKFSLLINRAYLCQSPSVFEASASQSNPCKKLLRDLLENDINEHVALFGAMILKAISTQGIFVSNQSLEALFDSWAKGPNKSFLIAKYVLSAVLTGVSLNMTTSIHSSSAIVRKSHLLLFDSNGLFPQRSVNSFLLQSYVCRSLVENHRLWPKNDPSCLGLRQFLSRVPLCTSPDIFNYIGSSNSALGDATLTLTEQVIRALGYLCGMIKNQDNRAATMAYDQFDSLLKQLQQSTEQAQNSELFCSLFTCAQTVLASTSLLYQRAKFNKYVYFLCNAISKRMKKQLSAGIVCETTLQKLYLEFWLNLVKNHQEQLDYDNTKEQLDAMFYGCAHCSEGLVELGVETMRQVFQVNVKQFSDPKNQVSSFLMDCAVRSLLIIIKVRKREPFNQIAESLRSMIAILSIDPSLVLRLGSRLLDELSALRPQLNYQHFLSKLLGPQSSSEFRKLMLTFVGQVRKYE